MSIVYPGQSVSACLGLSHSVCLGLSDSVCLSVCFGLSVSVSVGQDRRMNTPSMSMQYPPGCTCARDVNNATSPGRRNLHRQRLVQSHIHRTQSGRLLAAYASLHNASAPSVRTVCFDFIVPSHATLLLDNYVALVRRPPFGQVPADAYPATLLGAHCFCSLFS